MSILRRLGKAVRGWLERLAAENKKAFGGGELSCCTINRPKQTERRGER